MALNPSQHWIDPTSHFQRRQFLKHPVELFTTASTLHANTQSNLTVAEVKAPAIPKPTVAGSPLKTVEDSSELKDIDVLRL